MPPPRQPARAPLREWLYGAGVVFTMVYAAANEGDGRAMLAMMGFGILFVYLLFNSRSKRLDPKPKVRSPKQ